MKRFIPHRFWVDGILNKDIETYRDLSTLIIKESMKSKGLTFRKKNKKEYINIWLKYFESVGEEPLNSFMTIAETIFAERDICHKTQNHKMSSRYSNTVKFRIMKQLEQFQVKDDSLIKSNINNHQPIYRYDTIIPNGDFQRTDLKDNLAFDLPLKEIMAVSD